jgi:pilus assembly protein Flp/PilA
MALMRSSRKLLRRSRENESGQGLLEYALILALVSIVVVALLIVLGGDIEGLVETVTDAFS